MKDHFATQFQNIATIQEIGSHGRANDARLQQAGYLAVICVHCVQSNLSVLLANVDHSVRSWKPPSLYGAKILSMYVGCTNQKCLQAMRCDPLVVFQSQTPVLHAMGFVVVVLLETESPRRIKPAPTILHAVRKRMATQHEMDLHTPLQETYQEI